MRIPGPKKRRFIEEQRAKVRGKVSRRLELVIGRGYLYGHIKKPLELLSDKELLKIPGLGAISLYDLRRVVPRPAITTRDIERARSKDGERR